MAGIKGNKKHANSTSFSSDIMMNNENAEKWTFEDAKEVFIKIYENVISDNDILCLQDAYYVSNISHTTFYYLISKYPVLNNIKEDIQNYIIRKINKCTLQGDFNSTGGIWRMKQLGEKDTQYQEVNSNNTHSFKKPPKIKRIKADE